MQEANSKIHEMVQYIYTSGKEKLMKMLQFAS